MQGTVELMRHRLGDDVHERAVWSSIKRRFDEIIDPLPDCEFPKTFFSSVTRKTFGTVGVDPAVEFIALDLDPLGQRRTRTSRRASTRCAATSNCWPRNCWPTSASARRTATSSAA